MLTTHTAGNVTVLELSGRFDTHMAPTVLDWYEQQQAARVVINLAGVSFVDSSALAALAGGLCRCRQSEGDLKLCTLQQPVRAILELTRMAHSFDIFATEPEAVAAFAASAS
jgi:anti-sigma B factor antagonist